MPAEGSSSPSDSPTVEAVEQKGAGRGRVRILLSDGSFFFLLKEVQTGEGVYPGLAIGPEERGRLERLSQRKAATRAALSLLARAPHTRARLRLKLQQRGHCEEAIAGALERAEELGYLDDRRFAEDWVRMRLERHPEGRAALVAGLREHGVARELAEQTVARMVSDELEEQCLLRVLERAAARGREPHGRRPVKLAKLAGRLASLGFPASLIRRHLGGLPSGGE